MKYLCTIFDIILVTIITSIITVIILYLHRVIKQKTVIPIFEDWRRIIIYIMIPNLVANGLLELLKINNFVIKKCTGKECSV